MKGPTELESGSLAVPVVYTEPDSEETLDLQTKGSCAKSALEGKRVLQLWRAESQWYPSDVLDGVHLKCVCEAHRMELFQWSLKQAEIDLSEAYTTLSMWYRGECDTIQVLDD